MTRNRTFSALLSLAVAAPLLAAPVIVDAAPKHCPPGHAKKGWCSPNGDDRRGDHYRRDDRRDDRRGDHGGRGDSPARDRRVIVEYRYLTDYDRYGLRRPRDGYAYAVRNEEVFLINRATQEVIEGLGALKYLLNR